ncbi:hypothetical protein Clacol_008973 [Clathrus columnatus]|uniref:SPIN90/Ldb17 leucine-rich domain-containing protein n=1 Tax=Clathrus columnatus TaxID=1419009 RepID=A0AAV5AQP6_9AGAM|nr:hypothetical protein Clacol_008973 [Clathrus columnatus]
MDLGIVYHIEEPRQFWAELEDILQISPSTCSLSVLDAALRQFIAFCATYHQQYLQTPVQLEHACTLLIGSELFHFHSERLSSLVISDALTNTDPHAQLILQHILLLYGRDHSSFFRSHKKWKDLIPVLMDIVTLVDIDLNSWVSEGSAHQWRSGFSVPIETRLSQLSVQILYEVCRIQKFDQLRLGIFTDAFIDRLFELVESTRDLPDETFNYGLIKLIIALNEQFMVAALPSHKPDDKEKAQEGSTSENRIIEVLVRRSGSSKTFGENIIFMLNRAGTSSEDRCMQLLILKILYILFTTRFTQEYFYTNDLCVLVDVFIRELGDLSEENDSLRHTYLRVLHPLLTHTQLRDVPYKRVQILRVLESLVAQADIRNVSSTTKRLVERCLSAPWAIEARSERDAVMSSAMSAMLKPRRSQEGRASVPSIASDSDSHLINVKGSLMSSPKPHPLRDLKFSKSVDVLTLNAREDPRRELGIGNSDDSKVQTIRKPKNRLREGSVHDNRRGSGESSFSFTDVASAGPPVGNMRLLTSQGGNLLIKTAPKPLLSKQRRESSLSSTVESLDSLSLHLSSSPPSSGLFKQGFENVSIVLASPPSTPPPPPLDSNHQVKRYRPAPLPPSAPPSPPHSHSSASSSVSAVSKPRKIPPAVPSRSGKSVFRKNTPTNYASSVPSATAVGLELS